MNRRKIGTTALSTQASLADVQYLTLVLYFKSDDSREQQRLCQHLGNLIERPVDLLLGNDQRRGDADHHLVCFLAQHTELLQGFAEGTRFGVQLDANPQPLAANFMDVRTAQSLQFLQQVVSDRKSVV